MYDSIIATSDVRAGTWDDCLNKIKPGGHLLLIGDDKPSYKVAFEVEVCGFGLRDTIMWVHYDGEIRLLPAFLFRKPFDGSLVDNVLTYGVGGLNIDACKVGKTPRENPEGRFPANVVLSYNEKTKQEVCGGLPIGGRNGRSAARYFHNATYTELLGYLARLITPKGGTIYTPTPFSELQEAIETENANGARYSLVGKNVVQ